MSDGKGGEGGRWRVPPKEGEGRVENFGKIHPLIEAVRNTINHMKGELVGLTVLFDPTTSCRYNHYS